MTRHLRAVAAALGLTLAWSCPPCVSAWAEEPADLGLSLWLYDAAGAERTLLLDVARRAGAWERAWAQYADIGHNIHWGRITGARLSDEGLEFSVRVDIQGDSWVSSGRGVYRVTLARRPDGSWEGSHSGAFRGTEVKGRAVAPVRPPFQRRKPGYEPAGAREHPRILFRKQDLPALREKATTPFGQAALAAMNDAVGAGLKYQLLGDRKYADQAAEMVRKLLPEIHDGGHGRGWGSCLYQVGTAYDLCYDAWPEDFKRRLGDYMVWATERLFYRPAMVTGTANWHACSNYAGPIYVGPAFAGLALWGEVGLPPAKPVEPNAARELSSAKDYRPAPGVPVSKFQNDEMPGEWLFAGGFRPEGDEDPLQDLGGAAQARPEPGTKASLRGRTEAFRPLPHDTDKGYYRSPESMRGKAALDVSHANAMTYFSTNCFYTVIENDQPRWVRLDLHGRFAHAYLVGARAESGDCFRLERGLYPLLVVAAIDLAFSHRRFLLQPCLVEVSEEQVKAHQAQRLAEYQERLSDWEFEVAEWRRMGGADQRFVKLFEMGKRKMYQHYRTGVGTGGFQAEVGSYSLLGIQGPDIYATAYRNMFCVDASPYEDITHYVPRKMFAQVCRPAQSPDPRRGKPAMPNPLAQDINGNPSLTPRMFAAMFPIVPEHWKPAALWAWNYHTGISGPESLTNLFGVGESPVWDFLNYPLDAQPTHPKELMPLAWQAPTFGFYGFRSSWEGKDDIILQVFLKAALISGWSGANAGTFRLLGLGHVWAFGPTDRDRCRWEENVVQLPKNPEINDTALGKLVYVKTEKDGSGVVTVDLDDVYATRAQAEAGRGAPALYEKYTSLRRPAAFKDSGIHGLRSIAVDYSGKSGASCLLAIVDKITGGKSKVWTWQCGPDAAPKGYPAGNLKDTRTEGNTFAIRKPDGAVLRGTFAAPTAAQVKAEIRKESMIGRGGSTGGDTLARPIPGIFAQGPRGDEGDFFVVITLGRGEPPAVKVAGAGLAAKVTVGQRTVRFDGQKIVLEAAR